MTYDEDIMPEELVSERRMTTGIYVFDFFLIIAIGFLGYITRTFVASSLQSIYVIGNVAIGIYLTRYSKTNPKKRTYQAIRYLIFRPHDKYNSIAIICDPIQEEEFKAK